MKRFLVPVATLLATLSGSGIEAKSIQEVKVLQQPNIQSESPTSGLRRIGNQFVLLMEKAKDFTNLQFSIWHRSHSSHSSHRSHRSAR